LRYSDQSQAAVRPQVIISAADHAISHVTIIRFLRAAHASQKPQLYFSRLAIQDDISPMILDNPLRRTRTGSIRLALLAAGALSLAPLTARAGDPAAPAKIPPPPPDAPLTDPPAEAPAATEAAPASASAEATEAGSAPAPATQSTPAPRPPGWEGESAKDRLSASMNPHDKETIKVELRGNEGDTFYAWLGGGRAASHDTLQIDGEVFEQLCDSPCTAQLPAGRNRIAVARGGSPVVAHEDVTIYAPTTLTANYSSYAFQRILGAVVLVGGSVAGIALVFTAPECKDNPTDPQKPQVCKTAQKYAGIGVGVGSVVVGSLLLLKDDELEVSLAPGSPATGSQGRSARDQLADSLKGFQLNVRF
jgi:hypothetical protein